MFEPTAILKCNVGKIAFDRLRRSKVGFWRENTVGVFYLQYLPMMPTARKQLVRVFQVMSYKTECVVLDLNDEMIKACACRLMRCLCAADWLNDMYSKIEK